MTKVDTDEFLRSVTETLAAFDTTGVGPVEDLSAYDFLSAPIHDLSESIPPAAMEAHHDTSTRGMAETARRTAVLLSRSHALSSLDIDMS